MKQITAEELFDRCDELIELFNRGSQTVNRQMHEILVLTCVEGTRDSKQAYGNLFSQVVFLCKANGISPADRAAIQTMRHHSNHNTPLSKEELLDDVLALRLFISKVFNKSIEAKGQRIFKPHRYEHKNKEIIVSKRCIVNRFDENAIYVSTEDDGEEIMVGYGDKENGNDLSYIRELLHEGMQINVLDCRYDDGKLQPQLIVVEPDFLIDISSLAACFTDYGHHPLAYTISRMKQRPNSQAILLGNFAGSALDDIINNPEYNLNSTISNSFREQALQFCTCHPFSAEAFIKDAQIQAEHLKEVVNVLFGTNTIDRRKGHDIKKAMLEPSFVCERLGLQGRVDLMTQDMRLLVEQKSGKNWNIENPGANKFGKHKEDHFVQLLLYFGVLRYNFGRKADDIDMHLLYSKYPASKGLLSVAYYKKMFDAAIELRNRIVCNEFDIAHNGFGNIMPHLSADTINQAGRTDRFFEQYIRPQINEITMPLQRLTPLEKAYFEQMMTFVYREQLAAKVGIQDGQSTSAADLWNMPMHKKQETGNIFTGLRMTHKDCSSPGSGYDMLTFSVPDYGNDFLPNFRRGDMIYAYSYKEQPDVRQNILYKGTITSIQSNEIVVKLNDGQQNAQIFDSHQQHYYAIEHATSDIGTASSIRSLHEFITTPQHRRQLLLGQQQPQCNTTRQLSKAYNNYYDDILLRIKQANDYFLLVGPPGTGKTSMALRFMVEEELYGVSGNEASPQILITSYTNRAVDEICSMLENAKIDFLRLGNENSCDPRFRKNLLETALDDKPKLNAIKQRIEQCRVIVGTTSTLQARPFIFQLKHFSLAIIDEASQILEPNIIGLLAAHDRKGHCCIDRFVLIGDYKQLPAVVQQDEKSARVNNSQLRDICLTDCRLSLFERLIRWEKKNKRTQFIGILRHQGRMHPEIAEFPNEMFYREEQLEPVPCPHQLDTSLNYTATAIDWTDHLMKQRRMIFIPAKPDDNNDTSEKANAKEAAIVADILRRVVRFYGDKFNPNNTVGVIVPYRNQIAMIRREIEKLNMPQLRDISIDTVERYQGSQRDVIIYSFTIRRQSQLGFLTANCFMEGDRVIDRKLNVAITRARKQMIMTGNPDVLNRNNIFRELIKRYGVGD